MSFFAQTESYQAPLGSYGPLEEFESMMGLSRLRATEEQKLEAGQKSTIAFATRNAQMVMRSLGYEMDDTSFEFDAKELHGRVVLAQGLSPIADDGMENIEQGNMVDCGVRPGYFKDVYEAVADVCEFAIAWQIPVYLS